MAKKHQSIGLAGATGKANDRKARGLTRKPFAVKNLIDCQGKDRPKRKWSERQDSNLRRLGPKPSALARLSYAPTTGIIP